MKKLLFSLALTLATSTALAQFTAGRVVVMQVGTASNTGTDGVLQEYQPDGTPGYSFALHNNGLNDDGTSIVFNPLSAYSAGLNLSADHAFIVIPGFANAIVSGSLDSVAGTDAPRVVATVKYDGTTYARPIYSTTSFSGVAFRSATSDGFGNFWGVGNAAGGTKYLNTDTTVQASTGRAVAIADATNLWYCVAASVNRLSGLPQTLASADQTITATGASTTGFSIPSNPVNGSVAYVGDNSVVGGTIRRFTYSGSAWSASYSITLLGTDKAHHLTTDYSGAHPVIYVTTDDGTKLYKVVDVGPGAADATKTVIATTPSGYALRGVALSPTQPTAPAFTTQPSSQCLDAGKTLVLGPVAATGANPNGWTWKLGTATLTDGFTPSGSYISGSTTTTLTIQNLQGTDYGTYTAVAINNGGTTSSSGAVITPCSTCITIPPASITNVAGTTAHFTVSHVCLSATYAWYKDGFQVFDNPGKIEGASTASLTIYDVQDADAGNYSIKITHASGEADAGASLAVLDVPGITQQPANVNAAAGTTANFTVVATGGSLHYQWSKQGVGAISGATASALTRSNLQDSDAGSYRCVVTNLAGVATSDWAVLTVGHASSFTTSPISVTVTAGVSVVFTSAATGTASISYAWKHNLLLLSDDGHYSGTGSDTLSIDNVQGADAQTYTVTASNGYGSASATAVLTVVSALPKPHTIPGLVIYEPFNYPLQSFCGYPAPAGWVDSWQNIMSAWNEVTGQPAYWQRYSTPYTALESVDWPGGLCGTHKYPWKGIDCSVATDWYWSSAPNDNLLNFGGIDQTNGAAYFSFVLQVSQDDALSRNTYDVIAGLSAGGASPDALGYKLCTHASNGGDSYQLGLFKSGASAVTASSTNGQWLARDFGRGEVHFIVGCYKFNSGTNLVGGSITNDDVVSLWIDPDRSTFGASEGSHPAPDVGGTLTNWGDNVPIAAFAIKGTYEPTIRRMADLRIGTTWASVTHPYYPTIRCTKDLSGVTLAWPAKDSADLHGTGYVLQESPDLFSWSLSGNTPHQDGSEMKVTVSPGSGPFFRLIYP
jgi:Immunoglobulin I-set domain/Immunoglobulin domain